MEGEYSNRSSGYAQDMDIMLYSDALFTVRSQELPEDFDPKHMHPEHVFTTYTNHYYTSTTLSTGIGSERINSKLGTVNNLGILCEEMGSYDLINEMNTRTVSAGDQLDSLYNYLGKDLDIEAPYLYSESHRLVCGFKSHNPKLYDAYWYHPDHLGSSSFITNTTGEISQHMEYLPFGETLVEEHLNSYNSPFKFNAKEYDAETGNYYYGARYYDPKWSMWLGVDPLAEITMQPYSAFNNNPIYYNDPTGMIAEPPVNGLEWFADDTGNYFWNEEQGSYEHYGDPNGTGSNSFQGYYSADEFSEPVGDYSIIFDLSGIKSDDQYDPSNTIWSVAAPMLGYLEKMEAITFGEVKDISDQDKYPGTKIYSSEYMNGAITLGNLIITNPDMEGATLDHEYGHYLDFKHHFKNDKTQYLKDIGYPSLKSAAGSGNHSQSTTEKRANRLGGEWSGNTLLKNKHRDEK